METTKLLNSEFLDILFDDRNKDYGAYDLRRKYDKRVRNAVMGMSAIVVVIIGGYLISTNLIAADNVREAYVAPDPITIRNVDIEKPPVYTPPPVKQIEPPASKPMIKATTFQIVAADEIDPRDEVPKNADMIDKVIGVANIDKGNPDGADFEVPEGMGKTGSFVEAPKAKEKEEIFTGFIEIMPEFPGGEAALMKFLRNNTNYPTIASETGISGTVFVKFVVFKNGEIGNVVVEGAKKGGGLEEEAMRVVKKMPKWKPGRQNGENVSVYFNLPIRFTLADQQ
ncbi:energy transducer TonB [Chitinophaga sp. SYP-B3965]|uniref:energy transducer TonB n=1 Tax=Chitinophaga sp. SYP-B3965 TaxID=2663120 RepID=UPI00156348A9|nr:energy transducer TonB [Chitinophaga sp. SYP-B3965]